MFATLLALLLLGAALHVALVPANRNVRRAGELGLIWLLVGYCGLATGAVAVTSLAWPSGVAAHHGFAEGGVFQDFTGVALLGLALAALVAARLRGPSLAPAAVGWAVFFAGATWVHLAAEPDAGAGRVLAVLATHGGVALLLVACLVASRAAREC